MVFLSLFQLLYSRNATIIGGEYLPATSFYVIKLLKTNRNVFVITVPVVVLAAHRKAIDNVCCIAPALKTPFKAQLLRLLHYHITTSVLISLVDSDNVFFVALLRIHILQLSVHICFRMS